MRSGHWRGSTTVCGVNDAGPERSDHDSHRADDAARPGDSSGPGTDSAAGDPSPSDTDHLQGGPTPSGTDDGQGDSSPSGIPVTGAEAMAIAEPSTVRRAPRYGRIGVISAVVGVVFCALATFLFARPTEFVSQPGMFLLISVFLVPVFVFAGLAIALIVDGVGRRRRARRLGRRP